MATRRKRPTLRFDGKYWITTIYKPNGVRGTVSFGSTEARSEADIRIAFERWIQLYLKHPRKTLSFSSPYEALNYMINPATISTVGQLLEKYERIKINREGVGMALVNNATCSECHLGIPPQMYNELQKQDSLNFCPNCQRIIYWKKAEPST